jgi:hypothetical protein
LTEGCCAAANEKSAPEPGREPKTFHDSDELTNLAAAAQQNVRDCHCWKNEIALAFTFLRRWREARTKFDPVDWAEMSQRFLLTVSCGGG